MRNVLRVLVDAFWTCFLNANRPERIDSGGAPKEASLASTPPCQQANAVFASRKEQPQEIVYPKRNYTFSDPREYQPPAKITNGNITVLSDDDMHEFLRFYCKMDEIPTRVRGVSFRNSDGSDRQNILAHCHAGDQLEFKYYLYQGRPAYAVWSDWGQIGNLSEDLAGDLAENLASREQKCVLLGEILEVTGGYQGQYFGCNIVVQIYEKY